LVVPGGVEGEVAEDFAGGDVDDGEVLDEHGDGGSGNLIANAYRAVELSRERRAALTTGAVTGQTDVAGKVDRATINSELIVRQEGSRQVRRQVAVYNLDMILAVGYRAMTLQAVVFRQWATTVLKEYLVKGFAMDDERLKNPDSEPDYFDEVPQRIREIRVSEKRFYQRYATCSRPGVPTMTRPRLLRRTSSLPSRTSCCSPSLARLRPSWCGSGSTLNR